MKENTTKYFERAKKMLHAGKPQEALVLFSKTIELDPFFADAYEFRSLALQRMGRREEADADVQMARSLRTPSEVKARKKRPDSIEKIDMKDIHNVYDDLAAGPGDELDFEDDLYDYVFSDDSLESDSLLESLSTSQSSKSGIPSILEYLDGRREEVPWTYLFEPGEDELTLVYEEGGERCVITLEQLSCIRLTRAPSGFPRNRDTDCHVEIIETIDGNIFHEYIHPARQKDNVLFGFTTKKDSRFTYTLIPLQNIKKRFQRRHLGQILLDRNLISGDVLKNVLQEHNDLKKIKLGRILAEQAKILYSAVENEIQKAYSGSKRGLKVGEILVDAGLVSEEQIDKALAYQKRLQNRKIGHFLVEKGILQERDLYLALAEKFRIPFVDLRQQKGSKKVISLLPRDLITKLNILPLSVKDNNTLIVATLLPDPAPICEVILKYSPLKNIDFVLAQPSHLKNIIKVLFQEKDSN